MRLSLGFLLFVVVPYVAGVTAIWASTYVPLEVDDPKYLRDALFGMRIIACIGFTFVWSIAVSSYYVLRDWVRGRRARQV